MSPRDCARPIKASCCQLKSSEIFLSVFLHICDTQERQFRVSGSGGSCRTRHSRPRLPSPENWHLFSNVHQLRRRASKGSIHRGRHCPWCSRTSVWNGYAQIGTRCDRLCRLLNHGNILAHLVHKISRTTHSPPSPHRSCNCFLICRTGYCSHILSHFTHSAYAVYYVHTYFQSPTLYTVPTQALWYTTLSWTNIMTNGSDLLLAGAIICSTLKNLCSCLLILLACLGLCITRPSLERGTKMKILVGAIALGVLDGAR